MKTRCLCSLLLLTTTIGGPAWSATLEVRGRLMPTGPNPCAIAAADLNGDTWPEIVTCDRGTLGDPREERPANNELSLLIAQGNLEYVKQHPSLRTGMAPYAVTLVNVDALKWPDIVVANFLETGEKDLSLFLNLQQEGIYKEVTFNVPDDALNYARHRDGDGAPLFAKPGLTSVAVHDFDGDRLRDLLAASWTCDVLIYMKGHAEQYFDAPRFIPAPGGPRDVALGDFNGDGKVDLAVTLYVTNEIAIFQGDGQGGFSEVQRFSSRGRLPNRIHAADMNGDNVTDLVVSHGSPDDALVIFHGSADFRFGLSQELMLGENREALEFGIHDFTVADFNQDGHPDLAAACYESGTVEVLLAGESGAARVLAYRRESFRFGKVDQNARPRALCAADFDNNGRVDLAVALWNVNAVGLLLNTSGK